jgi:hypothetical protein
MERRKMTAIHPERQELTRKMLACSIAGDFDGLGELIAEAGEDKYRKVLAYCLLIAGYLVVDICGGDWPSDANIRNISRTVAEREIEIELDQDDIYNYLSTVVVGFQPLNVGLTDQQLQFIFPVVATGSMLFTYRPKGMKWYEYLNRIQVAYDRAEITAGWVLPAMVLTDKMLKASGKRNRHGDSVQGTEPETAHESEPETTQG